jgi:hypothetical protein
VCFGSSRKRSFGAAQGAHRYLILVWSTKSDIPGASFKDPPGNARATPWNPRPTADAAAAALSAKGFVGGWSTNQSGFRAPSPIGVPGFASVLRHLTGAGSAVDVGFLGLDHWRVICYGL